MTTFDLKSFIRNGYAGISVPGSDSLDPYIDIKAFYKHALLTFFNLPEDVLFGISEFRSVGNKSGYILIKNMPRDEALINTPLTHQEACSRQSFISEYCLAMVGKYLGELYGFAQESDGIIFNNIRPSPKYRAQQSSESSDVLLELHTEIAFHEFRPDFLLLYCLRQDCHKMARTGVASIRRALPLISKHAREELVKPQFSLAYDLSFGNLHGKNNGIKKVAVLEGDIDDPYMTYDSDLMTPMTEQAESALMELDTALRNTMHEVRLEAGDLIVIDNRRTSHSRTNFKTYYDGRDRWVQRVFVKQDLDVVRKRLPDQVPVIRDIV